MQPRDDKGKFVKGPSQGQPKGPSQGQPKGPSQGQPKGPSQDQPKGPSQGHPADYFDPNYDYGIMNDAFAAGMSCNKPVAASSRPKGPSQGHTMTTRAFAGGIDDLSGAETSAGSETITDLDGSRRKRPSSSILMTEYFIDSDDTDSETMSKVSTARRGRKTKAGVFKTPAPLDAKLKEALQRRQFRKEPLEDVDDLDIGTDSDVIARVGDISAMNAQELRAQAGEKLACILEVAKKSQNLKGEFVGRLKTSASTIREVIDALVDRSEAEETRRLRAENSRLRLEVESSKAEVKVLRRSFSEAKLEAATAATAAAATAPPAAVIGTDVVEELKRSLTIVVGDIINARLAGIEDRLLPAPTTRPPLRVDARRVAVPAAPPKPTPVPPRERPQAQPVAGPSHEAPATTTAQPQVETWATVVRKGKGKGKGKASAMPAAAPSARAPVAAPKTKPKTATRPTKPKVTTLKPLKTSAVVMSLRPEAVDKGVTYSAMLTMAQQRVNLQELGIDGSHTRFRQTATGARMLEISGAQNEEKADKLAEALRPVLSAVASVVRPCKTATVSIRGLDDAATTEKVATVVAEAAGCDVQLVKVGQISRGPSGTGSTLVACPIPAAKALLEKERLLVGWSAARVVALGARPLRCFRCMGLGHTRPLCPNIADRGDLCFRCGGTGHQAANCQRVEPRCAICAESGRPSGHVMGGRSCAPPKKRGKAAVVPAPCGEEAVMAE